MFCTGHTTQNKGLSAVLVKIGTDYQQKSWEELNSGNYKKIIKNGSLFRANGVRSLYTSPVAEGLLVTSYRLILVGISQNAFSSVKRRYRQSFTSLNGKEVDVNKYNKYSRFALLSIPETISDQINSRGSDVNGDLFIPPQNIYN